MWSVPKLATLYPLYNDNDNIDNHAVYFIKRLYSITTVYYNIVDIIISISEYITVDPFVSSRKWNLKSVVKVRKYFDRLLTPLKY